MDGTDVIQTPIVTKGFEMETLPMSWYHINLGTWISFHPKGKVITFWLWGDSELEIRNILDNKNIKDVEWVKKKKPIIAECDNTLSDQRAI